jgi:hypothetical protein
LAPSPDTGRSIPAGIRELHTALPDDFPVEVRELAALVVAQATTAFERSLLLENFFRSSGRFTYNASVSTGHSTLDLASWLLDPASRNYRTGYCEQFASAMALMARSLGIPSRMVMGFAPGELTTQEDGAELIVVRARNAHAWVELYMAGQGWVRFDPTPRGDGINPATVSAVGFDPALYLPAPVDPAQNANRQLNRGAGLDSEFLEIGADPTLGLTGPLAGAGLTWLRTFVVAVGIVALIPGFKLVRRLSRLRRLAAGDVGAGWIEVNDRLTDLGHPLSSALTPYEVASGVDPALIPLATRFAAAVYGNRVILDAVPAYQQAERALRLRHRGWRWWWSWWSPRSMRRDLTR